MNPRPIIGLLLVAAILVLYARYSREYGNRDDVCDEKPTEKERDQCRAIVDFAMSAGW